MLTDQYSSAICLKTPPQESSCSFFSTCFLPERAPAPSCYPKKLSHRSWWKKWQLGSTPASGLGACTRTRVMQVTNSKSSWPKTEIWNFWSHCKDPTWGVKVAHKEHFRNWKCYRWILSTYRAPYLLKDIFLVQLRENKYISILSPNYLLFLLCVYRQDIEKLCLNLKSGMAHKKFLCCDQP